MANVIEKLNLGGALSRSPAEPPMVSADTRSATRPCISVLSKDIYASIKTSISPSGYPFESALLMSMRCEPSHWEVDTMISPISTLSDYKRKTITSDHGPQGVEHILVNQTLGTQSYFCAPYCRKTDFVTITQEQLKRIEDLLNNIPRKVLNYRTRNKIYNESVALAP
jgi:hypothetical protein